MAAEIAGKALQKNWKVLHDQLNLDGLVPSLFQDELIDFNLKKDLEEFSNRQRRTDKFLNHLLENITEENFKTFVNLLRDDNNRKHQELGCRLKETFEKMIQNGRVKVKRVLLCNILLLLRNMILAAEKRSWSSYIWYK